MKKTSVVFMLNGEPIKTKDVIEDFENLIKKQSIWLDGVGYTVTDIETHINDSIHYVIHLE